jgi:hypothetical protein
MTNEIRYQEQIKAHRDSLIGTIALVKSGQWNGQEAHELAVQPTELFHIRYIGGSKETNKMMDDLFSLIIEAKKTCLNIS